VRIPVRVRHVWKYSTSCKPTEATVNSRLSPTNYPAGFSGTVFSVAVITQGALFNTLKPTKIIE
jgi:hypothetical protein